MCRPPARALPAEVFPSPPAVVEDEDEDDDVRSFDMAAKVSPIKKGKERERINQSILTLCRRPPQDSKSKWLGNDVGGFQPSFGTKKEDFFLPSGGQ